MNKITQWCKGLSWPVRPYRFSSEVELFQGGTWCKLERDREKKSIKPKACILQRQHYFETTRTYPIKNWFHLLQVVRAESKVVSPYGTPSLWAVTGFDVNTNTYIVTYWSLSQEATQLFSEFTCFIPETLLLKSKLDADVIYRIEADKALYFYHSKSVGIKSMQEDALVPTAPRFAELIHCASDGPTKNLTYVESQKILLDALYALPPWLMLGLYYKEKQEQEFDLNSYKWPAVCSGVILLSYAIGVSFYQNAQLDNLRAEIASKQQHALEIVTIESKVDERLIQWNVFLDYKKDYPGLTKTMSAVLGALTVSEATLTNYRLQGDSVTIYGLAPSATKTFEQIVSLSSVSNVKLDGNVSVDRKTKKERFIISLKFKGNNNES